MNLYQNYTNFQKFFQKNLEDCFQRDGRFFTIEKIFHFV